MIRRLAVLLALCYALVAAGVLWVATMVHDAFAGEGNDDDD